MQLSKVLDEIRERVGIENLTDSCSGRGCRVDMTDVPRDRIVVDMDLAFKAHPKTGKHCDSILFYKEQEIRLSEQATGVESSLNNTLHIVPDLDGEIYLKRTTDRHDVNGDGVVNILDLVVVANAFGKDAPDVNGDGVVNILDLVAVANAFGQ